MMRSYNRDTGFGLIEIIITVAIIGVLAGIAYPNYQRYIIDSKRTEVKEHLTSLANRIKSYKLSNSTYDGLTLNRLGVSGRWPISGDQTYTITLTPSPLTDHNWVLQASPQGVMSGDGVIRLNDDGHRCWSPNQSTCELSATTTWNK